MVNLNQKTDIKHTKAVEFDIKSKLKLKVF